MTRHHDPKPVNQLDDVINETTNVGVSRPSRFATYGLATVMALYGAAGVSCTNPRQSDILNKPPQSATLEYSLESLQNALGERWDSLSREQKRAFTRTWDGLSEQERYVVQQVYVNTDAFRLALPVKEQRRLEAIADSNSPVDYETIFPWFDPKNSQDALLRVYFNHAGAKGSMR